MIQLYILLPKIKLIKLYKYTVTLRNLCVHIRVIVVFFSILKLGDATLLATAVYMYILFTECIENCLQLGMCRAALEFVANTYFQDLSKAIHISGLKITKVIKISESKYGLLCKNKPIFK